MNEPTEKIIKAGLRSIAASVPGAASLAQAWNEYETHLQQQRIEAFFQDLKNRLHQVEARIRDVESYIQNSGEIPSLVERTVERVRRESDADKRVAFAILLANAVCCGSNLTYDDKLTFIEILDTLTSSDIAILNRFDKARKLNGNALLGQARWSPIRQPPRGSLAQSKIVASLSKLESRGLIAESSDVGEMKSWTGDATHWLNHWRLKSFELLPFGELFISLLKQEG